MATSQTDPAPAPAPQPQTVYVQAPEKVHRDPFAIQAELDAANAELRRLQKIVEEQNGKHLRAKMRREKLEAEWKKDNPGEPFDPTLYNPPAVVPSTDTTEARQFHRSHYDVARLQNELEESKRALVKTIA